MPCTCIGGVCGVDELIESLRDKTDEQVFRWVEVFDFVANTRDPCVLLALGQLNELWYSKVDEYVPLEL